MALRYSAMASSNWFLAFRALPRLLWAGVLGIEVNGLAEFGHGVVQLVLVVHNDAEVVVGLRQLGIEVDRLAVFGHGLVQLVLGL